MVQPAMKPIRLVVAAATLLLGACTPMQWIKDDGTAAQRESDEAQCREEAWREARFRTWAYRPAMPILLRDAAGRPFVAWHGGFNDPFHDPFFEESRLASFCMRTKGYRLERLEPPAPSGAAKP